MPDGLVTGYARGGPRNGVKLSAPSTWDGRVRKPPRNKWDETSPKMYPGKYIWRQDELVWLWLPEDLDFKELMSFLNIRIRTERNPRGH